MNVLIACEESQVVCSAFRLRGFDAYSCDIVSCSGGHPEWHIQSDVLPLINGFCSFVTMDGVSHSIDDQWDLIVAHPPCTYMSKAGARFMYPIAGQLDSERYKKGLAARSFFMQFYNCNCEHIAIENPTPLRCIDLPPYSQVIQPYYFGHPYSKRTLLWLKGLPSLVSTNVVNDFVPFLPSNTSRFSKGYGGSSGSIRGSKNYSKTFSGVAAAMAEQWGDFLIR